MDRPAVASRARAGEAESGDAWWVEEARDGVRVAVVDGLGHGPEAAAAANRALELVRAGAHEPLPAVVRRCHAGLHVTRGVALSLAHVDAAAGTVTWIGVGNVTCLVARPEGSRAAPVHNLLPARGVVGRRLPPLAARTVPVVAGEVLIMTTDGVDAHFQFKLPRLDSLQEAADDILRRFSSGDDDALVVMLRYRGAPA